MSLGPMTETGPGGLSQSLDVAGECTVGCEGECEHGTSDVNAGSPDKRLPAASFTSCKAKLTEKLNNGIW